MSTMMILDEEMNRLITLCTTISQTVSRIRLLNLSKLSFSPDYLKFSHEELLSMSENVEGSAVLLESLLAVERRTSIPIKIKKRRYTYSREELFNIRQYVSPSLSLAMKHSLMQVVERESNHMLESGHRSWRNIRTILV